VNTASASSLFVAVRTTSIPSSLKWTPDIMR
jgi:hypothetical protein